MILTNLATACRKKNSEQTDNVYEIPYKTRVSNKLNNMSKIVVMSGTATRESIKKNEITSSIKSSVTEEKEENYQFEFIQKTSYHEQFIKLQIPNCKSRHKNIQKEEKMMSKSCEAIFECLKSYKDITNSEDLQALESNQRFRGILKTDVNYERKTKRKVQFTQIYENPIPTFLDGQESHPKFEFNKIMKSEDKFNFSLLSECPDLRNITDINKIQMNSDFGGCQKTVSSEDFIESVVSISEPLTYEYKGFSEETE